MSRLIWTFSGHTWSPLWLVVLQRVKMVAHSFCQRGPSLGCMVEPCMHPACRLTRMCHCVGDLDPCTLQPFNLAQIYDGCQHKPPTRVLATLSRTAALPGQTVNASQEKVTAMQRRDSGCGRIGISRRTSGVEPCSLIKMLFVVNCHRCGCKLFWT